MNYLKLKSFWITLVILIVALFLFGAYYAPTTVTTCMPNYCDNEGGTTLDYRAEVGLLALGLGIIPAILISLLVAYLLNKKVK